MTAKVEPSKGLARVTQAACQHQHTERPYTGCLTCGRYVCEQCEAIRQAVAEARRQENEVYQRLVDAALKQARDGLMGGRTTVDLGYLEARLTQLSEAIAARREPKP